MKKKNDFILCTAYNRRYFQIGSVCEELLEEYCGRHGFQYYVERDENLSEGRPYPWAKIKVIRKLLRTYEWVFWLDADAFIIDFDFNIKDYLDENFDLIFASDENGINTGVGFYRSSNRMLQFLDEAWNCEYAINHIWWEQKAIRDLLEKPNVNVKAKIIPAEPINVRPEKAIKGRDKIIHLCGGSNLSFKIKAAQRCREISPMG